MSTLITLDFITLNEYPQVQVVAFKGQVDESNLAEVTEKIESYVQNESLAVFLFDFRELEFLNSKVIGYLADLHSRLTEKDRSLLIAGATPDVTDILELVGLTSLVPCYPNVESALQDLEN